MDFHIRKVSTTGAILIIAVIINAIVMRNGFTIDAEWYWGLCFTVPVLLVALCDYRYGKKSEQN